jgi:hypothetical protein
MQKQNNKSLKRSTTIYEVIKEAVVAVATFPKMTNKEEEQQEEKVIRCYTCDAVANSKEEAAASQFVTVRVYNARDKHQGAALEKIYSLCSDCHLIMKQRLIEGCDVNSLFSHSRREIEKEAKEEFDTNEEQNKKTGKQH